MEYFDAYQSLKKVINYCDPIIPLDENATVFNLNFESQNCDLLPGEGFYVCKQHAGQVFRENPGKIQSDMIHEILDVNDSKVQENCQFTYHVFKPVKEGKSKHLILLFHGFNEKYWDKYLPWAKILMEKTGSTVLLFPITFHMNRAPQVWSDRRLMFTISELRKKKFPDVIHSTLSNVAISTRIQCKPQRFFWSGKQTYYDVLQLVRQIKEGNHPLIAPDTSIDIFAYSIGSLLGEILMMANPEGIFDHSKLCMFCGGPVFNRMTPVSRFIIDSEANVALYSYVVEHLESHLKNDARMRHYFGKDHFEGLVLLSMLNYKSMKQFREERLRAIHQRIMAIALEQDEVVPPYEVFNTLQGAGRNIPIRIETRDFPYEYKHEDPFPIIDHLKAEVNVCFDHIFNLAIDFFNSSCQFG